MDGKEPGVQGMSLDERRVRVEEAKAELEARKAAAENRFVRRNFPALATGMLSLATIAFSYVQWKTNTRRAEVEAEQVARRADRDYDMETYKVVIISVSNRDSIQQYAALSLVARINDSTLKEALREALQRGGTAPVRAEAAERGRQEREFKRDQAQLATQTRASEWRYDVFHCDRAGQAASRLADSIEERLRSEAIVRKRLLTTWINSSPGYRVSGYQVRYEPSEEERAVNLLARLNAGGGGTQFTGVVVGSTTPNYLSIFVCP